MAKKYVHQMYVECEIEGRKEPFYTKTTSGTPINIEQALNNFELAYSMALGLSPEQIDIEHDVIDGVLNISLRKNI